MSEASDAKQGQSSKVRGSRHKRCRCAWADSEGKAALQEGNAALWSGADAKQEERCAK